MRAFQCVSHGHLNWWPPLFPLPNELSPHTYAKNNIVKTVLFDINTAPHGVVMQHEAQPDCVTTKAGFPCVLGKPGSPGKHMENERIYTLPWKIIIIFKCSWSLKNSLQLYETINFSNAKRSVQGRWILTREQSILSYAVLYHCDAVLCWWFQVLGII